MNRLIVLLLAGLITLPSLAEAATSTSAKESSGTKWALFGVGKKHNHSKKAPKAKKAKKSKKAGKSSHSAKASH